MKKTSENANQHLNTQTKQGVQTIADQERERQQALQQEADELKDTPLADQWKTYVQEYLSQQKSDTQGLQKNLQDQNQKRADLVQGKVDEAKASAQSKSDAANKKNLQENQQFE